MKKLLFLFLFSISFFAKGQTGGMFAPDHSYWSQQQGYWRKDGPSVPPVYIRSTQKFAVNGDTVIADSVSMTNMRFQKLFFSYSNEFDSTCLSAASYLYYDSNKVFIGTPPLNGMKLLYDFNLTVGDTFVFKTWGGVFRVHILLRLIVFPQFQLVEFCANAIEFTRIPFSGNQTPIVWVEGIGDITYGIHTDYGLIVMMKYIGNGTTRLDCFRDTSTVFGPSCLLGMCSVGIEEINRKTFLIYPNPFHTTATLQIDDLRFTNYDLKIFDVMGRLVRQQIINNKSSIINRDGLSDGLYFYELRTTSYELKASGKFVVE